jgi:hypothetical protein
MTLETINYIAQTVAAVVVVATLFAILYQGWQANRIARAELTLNVWMQSGHLFASLVDTTEKAEFLHRSLLKEGAASGAEKLRFGFVMMNLLGTHRAALNLRRSNLVEAGVYETLEANTRLFMRAPAARDWWARARVRSADEEFRSLVDAIVSEAAAAERSGPRAETAAANQP